MAPNRASGTDPGWEHGVAQDERKKKVKCNYCEKVVSGGIYRLKQHLAGISGQVTCCNMVPEEVSKKMKEKLEGHKGTQRKRRHEILQAQPSFDFLSSDNYENGDDEGQQLEEEDHVDYKQKEKLGCGGLTVRMPRLRSLGFTDPGWEHGVAQDDSKRKVKCNYCGKVVSGGINRFKQHLARIPGEVAYCKMVPEEVYIKMKDNMKCHRTGRRQPYDSHGHSPCNGSLRMENGTLDNELVNVNITDKDASFNKSGRTKLKTRSPCNSVRNAEPQLKQSMLDSSIIEQIKSDTPSYKKTKKALGDENSQQEIMSAICRFFCHAGIPFVLAKSSYFCKMFDLAFQYGQGSMNSVSQLISQRYLCEEVATIKGSLVEFKNSWMVTGCTILADTWKDVQGRTLINFLVSCPRGVYFVSSVDASEAVHDATSLFMLLDKIVDEVGEKNVVQVITEGTISYRTAGKMLEEKRENLFWTPCAAYCIDRTLEDFCNIRWVSECLKQSQKLSRFIHNRSWLINFMKKEFISGQELLRPSVTRYASNFSTMLNLLNNRSSVRKMFLSDQWTLSKFCKMDEGKEVERIVLNSTFWKKLQYVKKSVDPILQVLVKLDHEKGLPMPTIYNDMHSAKLAIKANLSDEVRRYSPFLNAIDNNCSPLFHHPLCLSAYFLNPSYRYLPDFLALPEVVRGLNKCIVRLEPDSGRRISASMQLSDFVSAKADFGSELAVSTRMVLDPAAWWQQHGISCPELQRIAILVLSQSSSSSVNEHRWSTFDRIRCSSHNRIVQRKMNDQIFIHYNLRLKDSQFRKNTDEIVSSDTTLLENLLGDWIVETGNATVQEDEETFVCDGVEPPKEYGTEVKVNKILESEPTDARSLAEIVVTEKILPPDDCFGGGGGAAADDNVCAAAAADDDCFGDETSE